MKTLPSEALRRWAWRLALAAALLATIGYYSTPPAVSPLMCKIYG